VTDLTNVKRIIAETGTDNLTNEQQLELIQNMDQVDARDVRRDVGEMSTTNCSFNVI
jgi:hypothetical protein